MCASTLSQVAPVADISPSGPREEPAAVWLSRNDSDANNCCSDESSYTSTTSAAASCSLTELITEDGNEQSSFTRDTSQQMELASQLFSVDDEHLSNSPNDIIKDVVLLQSALLESVAAGRCRFNRSSPEDSKSFSEILQNSLSPHNSVSPEDPITVVKPKSSSFCSVERIGAWADQISDDDDEGIIKIESRSISKVSENVFNCGWTAWYDPPRGRGARGGISKDTYEQSLFKMGIIVCTDELWAVHDMIDWNNLPSSSTISFSRFGSKPFWEDPIHSQGGRWIVRGIHRSQSEALFIKVVLSLFLNHLPDSDQFTCVSLQIKNLRRGNCLQLWTRSLDYAYAAEMAEHISCLVEPSETTRLKGGRRNRRRTAQSIQNRSGLLQFEFCPNSESIERNAEKLDGGFSRPIEARVQRLHITALASRCNTVSALYSEGHFGKKRRTRHRPKELAEETSSYSTSTNLQNYKKESRTDQKMMSTHDVAKSEASRQINQNCASWSTPGSSRSTAPSYEEGTKRKGKRRSPGMNWAEEWSLREAATIVPAVNLRDRFLPHSEVESVTDVDDLLFVEYEPELVGLSSCGYYDSRGCWYPDPPPLTISYNYAAPCSPLPIAWSGIESSLCQASFRCRPNLSGTRTATATGDSNLGGDCFSVRGSDSSSDEQDIESVLSCRRMVRGDTVDVLQPGVTPQRLSTDWAEPHNKCGYVVTANELSSSREPYIFPREQQHLDSMYELYEDMNYCYAEAPWTGGEPVLEWDSNYMCQHSSAISILADSVAAQDDSQPAILQNAR